MIEQFFIPGTPTLEANIKATKIKIDRWCKNSDHKILKVVHVPEFARFDVFWEPSYSLKEVAWDFLHLY